MLPFIIIGSNYVAPLQIGGNSTFYGQPDWGQILGRNLISFWSVWDGKNDDLVWEGLVQSHFHWNVVFLDVELQLNGVFALQID